MKKNLKFEAAGSVAPKPFKPRMVKMDHNGVLISERMAEIMSMCDRNNPIYEQVSSYSVALYTLGLLDCPDFMSFQDVSAGDAAEILNADFSEIDLEYLADEIYSESDTENGDTGDTGGQDTGDDNSGGLDNSTILIFIAIIASICIIGVAAVIFMIRRR